MHITDSLELARFLKYEHRSVIRLLRNSHLKDNDYFKENTGGRKRVVYKLTEEDCKYMFSRMKYTKGIKEFCSLKGMKDDITIFEHEEICFEKKLDHIINGFNVGTDNGFKIVRQFNVLTYNIDLTIGTESNDELSMNGLYPILFIEIYGDNHKYTKDYDLKRQLEIKNYVNWFHGHADEKTSSVRFCIVTKENEWIAISEIISILNGQLFSSGACEDQKYVTILE